MKTSTTSVTAAVCLATATFFAGAHGAQAKEQFPGEIAAHLLAPSAPPCGICHEYGKTGKDTLVTPFAWAMRARGLTGGGSALTNALDRMRVDAVDSDGDSATDIDELIAGTDPNSAASRPSAPGSFGDPQLGCAVAAGAGQGSCRWAAAFGLALAGLFCKRRACSRRSRR